MFFAPLKPQVNPNVLQKEDGKKHDFFHNSGARFGGGLLDRRVHG